MNINNVLKTRDAKFNFLKGIIRIAKCDGIKDENEFIFYHHTAAAMGLLEDDIALLNHVWESNETIDVKFEECKEKMFFFVQGIQLCWVDGKYEETEKIEIRKLANELNISLDAIEKVEAWVREGMEWNIRGDLLLELV